MTNETPKTWLITGAAAGFGRILAEAVLARGDRAVLTARDPAKLDDLVEHYPDTARALALDVTKAGDIARVVGEVETLDVLVNNAGHGLVGAVEEVEPAEYRPMFETNLFGLIELTRAALPLLRRSGAQGRPARVVNFSSVGGITGRPGFGLYNATKFAVEGLSEALAHEVGPLGVKVIIVEPGAFRTEFLGRSLTTAAQVIPAYDATSGGTRRFSVENAGKQPGDPARGIAVLLDAVDAARPPLRLALGRDAYARIREKLDRVAADLADWEATAADTDHRD
jgi:NAD(P)-dependent dehydrogenase (short-subunit alcohol dehydrogenase family)